MLLNAAKCQGYSFYLFWVIRGKPTGGKITPPPPRLGLKTKKVITPLSDVINLNRAFHQLVKK